MKKMGIFFIFFFIYFFRIPLAERKKIKYKIGGPFKKPNVPPLTVPAPMGPRRMAPRRGPWLPGPCAEPPLARGHVPDPMSGGNRGGVGDGHSAKRYFWNNITVKILHLATWPRGGGT